MKKLMYMIPVLLLLILVIISMKSSATTWYVDDDTTIGEGDPEITHNKIQDAINASSSDDTIYIFDGTYNETNGNTYFPGGLIITREQLTLIGETQNGVIINLNGYFYINGKGTKIINMTIDNVVPDGVEVVVTIDCVSIINITFNDGLWVFSNHGILEIINPTNLNTVVKFNSEDYVIVKYYLNIHVNDSLGNNIESAIVTIVDHTGEVIDNQLTNKYGWLNWSAIQYGYYTAESEEINTDTSVTIIIKYGSAYKSTQWFNNENNKLLNGHNEYIELVDIEINVEPHAYIYLGTTDVSGTTIRITSGQTINFTAIATDANVEDTITFQWIIIQKYRGGMVDDGITRGEDPNGSYLFDNITVGTYILWLNATDDGDPSLSNITSVTIIVSAIPSEDDNEENTNGGTQPITVPTSNISTLIIYGFVAIVAIIAITKFGLISKLTKIFRR